MFSRAASMICRVAYKPVRRRVKYRLGGISGNGGRGPKFTLASDSIRRAREEIEEWDTIAAKSRAFQMSLKR